MEDLINGHSSKGQGEKGRLVHGMKHVDIEIWLTTDVHSRNDGRRPLTRQERRQLMGRGT